MEINKNNLAKRWGLLCVSLFIMAFGVAFSIKAGLGTSPISSLPYVVSLFTPVTVGMATIFMHCVFIFLQIILLRNKYNLTQLMQLPVAIIFGYLTDFAVYITRNIQCSSYIGQWIICIIGIILVGIGVNMEVRSKVITLAGEGLILAICEVFPIKFDNMKVLFDVSLVIASCILSFIFLGRLEGVREGTIVAAICVGLVVKEVNKIIEYGRNRCVIN